jgi:hypothetical protein
MRPPQQFFDDLDRLCAHFDWLGLALGRGDDEDAPKCKVIAAEFHEFDQRWRAMLVEPEVRDALERVREIISALDGKLTELFLKRLHQVVAARKDWLQSEAILKAVVAITVLRREMPEHLRAEFEETIRDRETGESFEGERHFRECEKGSAEAEIEFRQSLAGLAVDWPERVDAALRERLEKLDADGAKAWEAQIALEMEKSAEKEAI